MLTPEIATFNQANMPAIQSSEINVKLNKLFYLKKLQIRWRTVLMEYQMVFHVFTIILYYLYKCWNELCFLIILYTFVLSNYNDSSYIQFWRFLCMQLVMIHYPFSHNFTRLQTPVKIILYKLLYHMYFLSMFCF